MLKKTFQLLILNLAISYVLSSCKEGCLKCDVQRDLCQLCDLKDGFQTIRGRCVKSQQKNCSFQNYKGNCLRCNPGYFVDSYSYTCVESDKAGSVANCQEYLVDNKCTICKTGFHLTIHNTCVEMTSPIDNCRTYVSQGKCYECLSGFMMNIDSSKCITPPLLNKCASYTPLRCLQCQPGYYENKNQFVYELLNFNNNYNYRILQNRLMNDQQPDYLQYFKQCQALTVPNCEIHSNFKTCVKCNQGYFHQLGACVAYPFEKIYNCSRYSSADTCIQCLSGMYLKSSKECVKVNNVPECVTYEASASQTSCSECQKDYYLSEPNVCTKRTKLSQINQCTELDKRSETCLSCERGLTLTSDKKKCLNSLVNCKQYALSDSNTRSHSCDVCADGFYYDQNKKNCEPGSIEKCESFFKNSNTCEKCLNRFYLSGGQCKNHDDLKYCDIYENSLKNTCKKCNDRTLQFIRKNTCLPVEVIEFCDTYKSTTECMICIDGYEITSDQRCKEIPKNQFCLQKSGLKCVKCIPNYILQQGVCQLPLHHFVRNCEQHNTNGIINYSQFKCDFCRENFIPINFKESFACFENAYATSQLKITLLPNCIKYQQQGNLYVCQACQTGYLLHNDTCILGPNCPPETTLRLQTIQQVDQNGDGSFDSFYVDKINVCGLPIKNCEIAVPDLNQNMVTVSYACTKCRQSAISVVTFGNNNILQKPETDAHFSPISFTASRVCEGKLTSPILGELVESLVPSCDLYYGLGDFGYGCLKCQHGFTGLVKNLVYKCKVYSSLTTCKVCEDNFHPKTTYRCDRVKPVQFCQKYENNTSDGKCIQCHTEFILDAANQTCLPRDSSTLIENCQDYSATENKCAKCNPEWYLSELAGAQKCIRTIEGCTLYDHNSLLCTKCADQWYILQNLCYPGKVSNCDKYKDGDQINKCDRCKNKYYLSKQNTCENHPEISGCDSYQQKQGYCSKCQKNNFLFLTPNKCIETVKINHCIKFKSRESCLLCSDGYYPVNYGQRCLQIPVSKNCLKWGPITANASHDENNCLLCSPGHLLINKSCRKWFDSVSKYCFQDPDIADGLRTKVECKYCKIASEFTFNENISASRGVCIENDLLQYYSQVPTIQNCTSYTWDNTNKILTCNKCSSGFFLYDADPADPNTLKKCVTWDECSAFTDLGKFAYAVKNWLGVPTDTNNDLIFASKFFIDICKVYINTESFLPASMKCLIQPAITPKKLAGTEKNIQYVCVQCPADKPIVIVKRETDQFISYKRNPASIVETVIAIESCETVQQTNTTVNLVAPHPIVGRINGLGEILNCEYYGYLYDLAPEVVNTACVACKKGFRGIMSDFSQAIHAQSFIQECVQFQDCNSNIDPAHTIHSNITPNNYPFLTMFPTQKYYDLNLLFNGCNSCTLSTQQLVSFVSKNTLLPTTYLSTDYAATTGASTGVVFNMQCLAAGTHGTIAVTLVQNCAKVIAFVAETGPIFECVQCKPGYFPTRDTTNPGKITACTLFNNCEDSTLVGNICKKCKPGYYFQYDGTNNVVSYEMDCDQLPLNQIPENCYAKQTTGACAICKKGYQLKNISGVNKCIQVKVANCKSFHQLTQLKIGMLPYINSFLGYQQEYCEECESGFSNLVEYNLYLEHLISQNFAPNFVKHNQICIETEQQHYNTLKPTASYVMCNEKYSHYLLSVDPNNLDIHCRECTTTGVITLDGKCVLKSDNLNCLVVKTSTGNFCHKCSANYISVAGVCLLQTSLDQNCATFADTTFKTGSICSKCKDYYYLESKVQDNKYITQCILYYPTGQTSSVTVKPIKNCVQFNSSNLERLFCTQCESNYALLILDGDQVGGQEGFNRKCIQATSLMNDMKCKKLELSAQQQGQLICSECMDFTETTQYFLVSKTQRQTVAEINEPLNSCVLWNPDPNCDSYHIDTSLDLVYLGVTYNYNFLPRKSSFKCISCKNSHFLQQDTNLCQPRTLTYSDFCLQFEVFQDLCAVCKENYFLSPDRKACNPAPINTKSFGHLFSCRKMDECVNSVIYQGLHPHLEQIYSCHKCRLPSQIPFAAVSGGASFTTIDRINQWGLSEITGIKTYKDNDGEKAVFCSDFTPAAFKIDTAKWSFPQNCALGVLNVDSIPDSSSSTKLTLIDRNKLAVFCGACKPGYRAVYGTDTFAQNVQFVISNCEVIQNCAESTAFNSCTKCSPGFAFEFQDGKVNYGKCSSLPSVQNVVNQDCFSYDTLSAKCVYCCKGTYLNNDNFCERINPPKCEFEQFNQRNIYNIKNLAVGLYLDSQGTGCNRCEAGFIGVLVQNNYWICTESMSHKKKILPLKSNYVNNCKNYQINNNLLKCVKCEANFIPIDSTGLCTALTSDLNSCILAQDATFCKTCTDDSVLVNRKCEKKNILNCEIYTYDEKTEKQICKECELGFYLDANRCSAGEVANCLRFETKIVCNTCKTGFQLVKRNNGISYCYPIDQSLNCEKFHFNDFQQANLTCTQCITKQFVISTDQTKFYKTHCLRFFEINNCVKYHTKPALADSSFQCIECTPQFFNENNQCHIRTIVQPKCVKYALDSDKCIECGFGFYASPNGNDCLEYPTGIKNCKLYNSKYNCIQCIQNHFIFGDYCIEIKQEERIENCAYYVDKFNCEECSDGFQLKDKKCQKNLAENCETLESITSCATCLPTYGFVETNGIKSCVQQNIPECLRIDPAPVADLTQKYKCVICKTLFFPDATGVCQPVSKTISNCEEYLTTDTCNRCSRQTALSVDKKSCLSTRVVYDYLDINCTQTQVLPEPVCNSCKPGFIFEEGNCVICDTDSSSCYSCDPLNRKKCLMCNPGYRMDFQGECKNSEKGPVNPPVNPTPKPNGEIILEMIKLLALFFLF